MEQLRVWAARYVETGELGRPHGTAYKQTAIGIVGFGSQMVPIFFGQGVEFRVIRLTDTHEYQLFPTDGAQFRSGEHQECRGDRPGRKLGQPTKSPQNRRKNRCQQNPNPLLITR